MIDALKIEAMEADVYLVLWKFRAVLSASREGVNVAAQNDPELFVALMCSCTLYIERYVLAEHVATICLVSDCACPTHVFQLVVQYISLCIP